MQTPSVSIFMHMYFFYAAAHACNHYRKVGMIWSVCVSNEIMNGWIKYVKNIIVFL